MSAEAAPVSRAVMRLRIGHALRKVPLIEFASLLIVFFIYLPVLVVVVFSFNDATVGVFPLKGFTLRWYQELLRDPRFLDTTKNSLTVAVVSTMISGVLGIAAAFGLARYRLRFRRWLAGLFVAPLLLPGELLGIALVSYFTFLTLRLSLFTVVLSHTITSLPFFYLILNSRLQGFDRSVEEAARDLGATSFQTFRRITLPLIWPSILGCAVIVFANSVDNFIVTFFTIGAESTLPLLIWSMLRRGVAPSVNAISSVLLLVTLGGAVLADRVAGIKWELV